MFYNADVRDLFDMKLFVDTDADTRLARRGKKSLRYHIDESYFAKNVLLNNLKLSL